MNDAEDMPLSSICHYFVDEAGDDTIFNKKGKVIIGQPGCSRFFILGLLQVKSPENLEKDLSDLRVNLLADSYFKQVPSMQSSQKKTALLFHAKDDLPEVRWQVFKILLKHEIKFFAVVREKVNLLGYVRSRNEKEPSYRYKQNELYDYLTRLLFKDRLHKEDSYKIFFAKRGQSDRTAALKNALQSARQKFTDQWGITSDSPIEIVSAQSHQQVGLQATDYCLWALQRLYERGEDRYMCYMQPSIGLIRDLDDTQLHKYGVYYTRKNLISAEAVYGSREREMPGI